MGPRRVLLAQRVPVHGLNRSVVDPDPSAAAAHVSVVVAAVEGAAGVHDVAH
jgi:hypothetical protein